MTRLTKWPRWAKAWFFGVLIVFWVSKALFAYKHGNRPYLHTDGQSEWVAIHGAKHFVTEGFFKNWLLPTYPGFGHAPGGKPRAEPFVYTHYLAGPELTMGLFLKAFGLDAVWAARLVPHTFSVVAMGWLVVEFAALMASPTMGIALLVALMVPKSLTAWTICLHGHAYAMAIFICLMAGLLSMLNKARAKRVIPAWQPWTLGALVGFGQMFYELDWIPLSWIAAMALICLRRDFPLKQGIQVCLAMVFGGIGAAIYQITLSSLYNGSLFYTLNDYAEWLRFRRADAVVEGFTLPEGKTLDDLKLHKLLHEYNRQAYGATGFTGMNLFWLSLGFIGMGYWGHVRNGAASLRMVGALFLAYLASAVWNIGMRQHSLAHLHFIPRHYFALYLFFCFITLSTSYALVTRSRAFKS